MAKRKKKVSDDVQKRLDAAGLSAEQFDAETNELDQTNYQPPTIPVSQEDSLPSPAIAEFKSVSPIGEATMNTTEMESTIDNSLNQIGSIVTRLQMDLAGRSAANAALVQTVQQKALSSLINKTASGRQAVDDIKMKVNNALQKKIGDATQPIVDVQEKFQAAGNDEVVGAQGQDEVAGVAEQSGKWSISIPGGPNPADWSKDSWPVWQSPTSGRYLLGKIIPLPNPMPNNPPTNKGNEWANVYISEDGIDYYGCPDGSTPTPAKHPDGWIGLACKGPPPDDSGTNEPSTQPPSELPSEDEVRSIKPPPKLDTNPPKESIPGGKGSDYVPPTCTPPKPAKPDCEEVTYNVYCTEGGTAYILKKGDTPHSPSDKLIDSGTPSTSWVNSILNCAKQTCSQPELPSSGLFLPGTSVGENIGFKCDMGKGLSFHSPSFQQLIAAMGLDPNAQKQTLWSFLQQAINPANFLKIVHESLSLLAIDAFSAAEHLFACPDSLYVALGIKQIPLGILNTISRGAFDNEVRLTEYARNQQCQTILPSGSDAISAWLAGEFSLADAECILKSNGMRIDWASRIAIANRTKWTPLEAVSMYRRGIIDANEYTKTIRSNGYIYEEDSQKIWELSKQIPVIQDIVRFMVRDTDDEKVVQHFGLDSQFTEKYGKDLKKWGEEQGIDTKYALHMWRAHWSIPSPTQLYEMYRRLRWNKDFTPNNGVVEDIKTALVQQDILPFWIERLLDLATLPLTRTDAKRAFMINSIDSDRLWLTFVHGGYSDEDATTLTEFVKKEKTLRFGRHPITKRYALGQVSNQELEKILSFEGAKQEDIDNAKTYAKQLTRIQSRTACQKAIKRRFMLGEVDFADLIPKYTALGIDPDIASMLATEAECERSARGKRVPLMTLSKWYKAGVIDKTNLAQRMTALQFSWEEIETTIDYLDNELAKVKAREDEMKAAKKAAAAKQQQLEQQRKQAREANAATKAAKEMNLSQKRFEKSLADAKAYDAKQKANVDKQLKAANAAKNRMEDFMLKIAEGLVKAFGSELGPSLRFAKNTFSNIKSRTLQTGEDVLRIGIVTLADKSFKTSQDFADAWDRAVREGVNFPGDDTPTG